MRDSLLGARTPQEGMLDRAAGAVVRPAAYQVTCGAILGQIWGHVLPRPEVFIGSAQAKFDVQGKLTDETTRKFLTDLLVGFKAWIERMKPR